MRIALAGPGYPPTLGGVEQVIAHSAHALARAGHSVEVFAQERSRALAGTHRDGPVTVHRFPSHGPRDLPLSPSLWRALAVSSGDFDVVHGHSYHTLAGLAAALGTRAPFVYSPHYHGTGHSPARAALHRIYRPVGALAFRRADAVVCVSGAEAGLVAEHFPFAAAKSVVVPNGVDRALVRAAQPYPGQPPTVLSVGRLERYKRIDRLLHAFARLPRGEAQLVIIGAGPDRARLTALAHDLSLLDPSDPRTPGAVPRRVRFLGRVPEPELHRWLRTSRVLCSLSEHEAFGLAPAEALVAGARVIASDIPAHRELLGAGPVQLVPLGAVQDTRALTAHLDHDLHADRADQAGHGDRGGGARAAEARAALPGDGVADWDEVARRLIAVYQAVLTPRAGALT